MKKMDKAAAMKKAKAMPKDKMMMGNGGKVMKYADGGMCGYKSAQDYGKKKGK